MTAGKEHAAIDSPATGQHPPGRPLGPVVVVLVVAILVGLAGTAFAFMIVEAPSLASAGCPSVAQYDPTVSTINNQTFTEDNSLPPGVSETPAMNSITLTATGATLLIEGAPGWYPHSGNYFLSYGLVNPQLSVPSGEPVRFEFINMDNESHDFALTTQPPPYPYMPMMSGGGMMGMGGGSGCWLSVGSMMVNGITAPSANPVYQTTAATLSFAGPGTFWYLCLMPGHAQSGMYGQLTVRG